MATIQERIAKDLQIFAANVKKIDKEELSADERRIFALAEMYAKDCEAFAKKEDYYTSFSSIAYAHGLLDAILKLHHKQE